VLLLQREGFVPGSDCRIENDYYYDVNVNAFPRNEHLEPGNWNFSLRFELP
jgi:hypothetical protein